jgi:hypothetical protein
MASELAGFGRKFRADITLWSVRTLRLNLGGSSDVKIRDSASADHLHPRVRSTYSYGSRDDGVTHFHVCVCVKGRGGER